jgi:hypothetical protein
MGLNIHVRKGSINSPAGPYLLVFMLAKFDAYIPEVLFLQKEVVH